MTWIRAALLRAVRTAAQAAIAAIGADTFDLLTADWKGIAAAAAGAALLSILTSVASTPPEVAKPAPAHLAD